MNQEKSRNFGPPDPFFLDSAPPRPNRVKTTVMVLGKQISLNFEFIFKTIVYVGERKDPEDC